MSGSVIRLWQETTQFVWIMGIEQEEACKMMRGQRIKKGTRRLGRVLFSPLISNAGRFGELLCGIVRFLFAAISNMNSFIISAHLEVELKSSIAVQIGIPLFVEKKKKQKV